MSLKFMRWMHQRGLSRKRLRGGRLHGWFGGHLFNPHLWRLEREGVSRAVFWGSLSSLSPFFGFHLLMGTGFAMCFRANIPVTMALQFITNPATIIFYYPAAYVLGCRLMGEAPMKVSKLRELFSHASFWDARHSIAEIWWPLCVGCLVCGLVVGTLGWALVRFFWPQRRTPVPQPIPKSPASTP
jgi:uncharacterized protein